MNTSIQHNFKIHWNMSGEDIVSQTKGLIQRSIEINKLLIQCDFNNESQYKKFLGTLSDDLVECTIFHSMCSFLQFVSGDPSVRKASSVADGMLSQYLDRLNMNKPLYTKITEYYIKADSRGDLDEQDLRFIRKIVRTYKRNGINLKQDKRETLLKINQEISKINNHLTRGFHNCSKNLVELTAKETRGVPPRVVNSFPKVTTNPLKYGVSIGNESFIMCSRFANSGRVRRNLHFYQNCKNVDLIDNVARILVLKHKQAKMLNYNSYSDYKLRYSMAHSADKVKQFLNSIMNLIQLRYHTEIKILTKLKKKCSKNSRKLHQSDTNYYTAKWEKVYGVDSQKIAEYFPINPTVRSILELYGELFQIKFDRVNDQDRFTFHQEATLFKVHKDGKLIGHVFLDLYSRPGKVKQTRCFCLQPGCVYPYNNGKNLVPIVALVGSVGRPQTPSSTVLLNHSQVVTIFHEMGHVIHHLFGKSKYSTTCGTNVQPDFVEVPALVLENLCWDPRVLSRISKHYKLGTEIPNRMVLKLVKSRNLCMAMRYKSLLLHSTYDQMLHSSDNLISSLEKLLQIDNRQNKIDGMVTLFGRLYEQMYTNTMENRVRFNKGSITPDLFDRLIVADDATYYKFLWSKVCALDIYTEKFSKWTDWDDLTKVCTEFTNQVLSKGGTQDGSDILMEYLGRDHSLDGFVKFHKIQTNKDRDHEENSFLLNTEQFVTEQLEGCGVIIQHHSLGDVIAYKDNGYTDTYPNKFSEAVGEGSTSVDNEQDSVPNKMEYIRTRVAPEGYRGITNNQALINPINTETIKNNTSKIFMANIN